ncbi:MAG: hypothetical protein F6K39_09780 [Okeania sp. SIO3B3]|nr:hypothetical protein [Okeania sp. SIO3B3]
MNQNISMLIKACNHLGYEYEILNDEPDADPDADPDEGSAGDEDSTRPQGDTDGDGVVGASDVAQHFDGSSGADRDANGDGFVDARDLRVVLAGAGLDIDAHRSFSAWRRSVTRYYLSEVKRQFGRLTKRERRSVRRDLLRVFPF